nr:CBS domain-containing protein [Pseudomonadales bacterium]
MDNEEQNQFQELGELVATGTHQEILSLMSELKPEQLADLLESSPVAERKVLWDLCDPDLQSEVLEQIDDELAPALLEDKSATEIAGVLENVEDDDSTDILQQLPDTLTRQVLEAMDTQDRRRMENLLSYQEDTAAGLMNTDTISVRPQVTVDVVLRYLRRHNELPKTTDKIFVVNTNDVFIGLIPLTTLLVSKPSLSVYDIMITEAQTIAADLPEHDVAQIFERYDLVSAPVLDEGDRLLGRITIDDVVDVIIEEADHSILGMAGLTESEDRFGTILRTARSRAVWLGANLITAFMAAYVI